MEKVEKCGGTNIVHTGSIYTVLYTLKTNTVMSRTFIALHICVTPHTPTAHTSLSLFF